MHCVLLGVTKQMLGYWMLSSNRGNPFYIGDKVQQLDSRLLKIIIPDFFSRKPRSLAEHKSWKANELRSWLLYYSLPILQGVLADLYYVYFLLLSASIHLLTRESIGEEDYTAASQYLEDFCNKAEFLYGSAICTINLHLYGICQRLQSDGDLRGASLALGLKV
ncbi:uncharacterized protein LOC134190118 [Corticium candelabrum]|uniref:uncharacterized protein LOC134190118 n=1 Tax=Corticium candelabrum TaxID=121492 RepID=UPI002E25D4A1|nr:uncharacterized protein LOC134190118 [Corticium candelabrum]